MSCGFFPVSIWKKKSWSVEVVRALHCIGGMPCHIVTRIFSFSKYLFCDSLAYTLLEKCYFVFRVQWEHWWTIQSFYSKEVVGWLNLVGHAVKTYWAVKYVSPPPPPDYLPTKYRAVKSSKNFIDELKVYRRKWQQQLSCVMVADLPQEIPIFCDFTHSQNCKLDDAPSSKNA